MGFLSGLDWFFSANVLKSLFISILALGGGIMALCAPRFFHYHQDSKEYDISLYVATGAISFGLGWLVLDALWTHIKVLYLCMTRDSLRERLIQTGPATTLA